MTEATSNAKQVFYLLVEFDQDYGEFPSDGTAKEIKGMENFSGKYSNDYFRQLIAAGYTKSEEIFYAKRKGSKKPDNDISSPDRILGPGECGFVYVRNQDTSMDSGRPVLVSPMTGNGLKFDSRPFDSKAVILRIDGSVKQLRINRDGDAVVKGSQTLFQPGKGTVWEGHGFKPGDVVFPEPAE